MLLLLFAAVCGKTEALSLSRGMGLVAGEPRQVSDQHAQLVGHVNHRQKIRRSPQIR